MWMLWQNVTFPGYKNYTYMIITFNKDKNWIGWIQNNYKVSVINVNL